MSFASYQLPCSVVLFVLLRLACAQDVGGLCTLQSTGQSGTCQLISNCPTAVQQLQQQGLYPQNCGFQGNLPVVCCTGSVNTAGTPATPVTPATPTPTRRQTPSIPTVNTQRTPPPSNEVGAKSRAKCKEYGKYIYFYPVAGGPASEECVIENIQLIVGGTAAKPKEFPHMALIGFESENQEKLWKCGGSLISERFVLTAGHCLFYPPYGQPKYIRLGELNLDSNTDDAEPEDYEISEWIRYPQYRPPSQYNDIALLKLNRPALLSVYVRPACLDTDPVIDMNINPIATGWGKVNFTADTSQKLLKVVLEYFTYDECNNAYKSNVGLKLRNGIQDGTQICAGSHSEAKDTCQGDSGGPLQIVNEYQQHCTYRIVGVTSFGKGCGVVNIPGVYTRVSYYIEWIESIVWP